MGYVVIVDGKVVSPPTKKSQADTGTAQAKTARNSKLSNDITPDYVRIIDGTIVARDRFNSLPTNEQRIGFGSFGEIYKLTIGNTTYAAKVNFDKANGYHEATMLANLKQANIIRYIDHFESNNNSLLILPFAEKSDLEKYIQKNALDTGLETEQLHQWTLQIMAGLRYLADNMIVHGDLKLNNLLIMNQIVISDFGHARKVGEQTSEFVYRYSPPELLTGKKPATLSSDIYALGIVMYSLALGKLELFPEYDDLNTLCHDIVYKQQRPSTPESSDQYKQRYYDLFRSCWKDNPAERPSAQECATALMKTHSS